MNTHPTQSGESLRPSPVPLRMASQHSATRGPVRCSTCKRHGNPSTTEEAQPHADHAQVGSPAASIAQWQSVCFVSIRSWVQSPVGALFIRHDRQMGLRRSAVRLQFAPSLTRYKGPGNSRRSSENPECSIPWHLNMCFILLTPAQGTDPKKCDPRLLRR